MAKNYTIPKLHIPNDKEKQWYVWYRFRVPGSNTWRKINIKKGLNKIQNTRERKQYGKNLALAMAQLLQDGFNPFLETLDMTNSINKKDYTVSDAFKIALKVKSKEVKETTYRDYESRVLKFQRYLKKQGYGFIKEVDKASVSIFLAKFSSKNSNNFRAAISSIFSVLSEQSIVDYNFVRELRAKKETKKAIILYSEKQIREITEKLKLEDKRLLIYIQLISYMFWRPIEIVRINLKDVDLVKMRMRVNTKGKDFKVKIIPAIIIPDLIDFIGTRKSGNLFELKAVSDVDKRNHLTNTFRKFRERHNFNSQLKSYSFRHTYITKIYLQLRKENSKAETIERLSLITGHTSNAIWKYIKINDVELPEDYSHLLNSETKKRRNS